MSGKYGGKFYIRTSLNGQLYQHDTSDWNEPKEDFYYLVDDECQKSRKESKSMFEECANMLHKLNFHLAEFKLRQNGTTQLFFNPRLFMLLLMNFMLINQHQRMVLN